VRAWAECIDTPARAHGGVCEEVLHVASFPFAPVMDGGGVPGDVQGHAGKHVGEVGGLAIGEGVGKGCVGDALKAGNEGVDVVKQSVASLGRVGGDW